MRIKTLLAVVIFALPPVPATACTLWGAAGAAADGGTLISKNRDWKPDHTQYLKMVRPKKGLAYFGLFAEGNDEPGLKAGVNEKGLTIISASSNIPRRTREQQMGEHGLMRRILEKYDSVDSLVGDAQQVFSHAYAAFLLVSDRSKVLSVEIGLDGKFALKVTESGPVTHTNHYLDPQLAALYNRKTEPSSETRLTRVNTLLTESSKPHSLDQFSAISRDHHDGADNSLWRNGRAYTMASWIVASPAVGAPRLRVVIANPGEAERLQEFVLDRGFWESNQRASFILPSAIVPNVATPKSLPFHGQ
jgi:hypothetical protein